MQKKWWSREKITDRLPFLEARGAVLGAVRAFFASRDFREVETPALQVSPGMEPHLRPFATTLNEPDGARRGLYLHTSPEFAMKKLLVAGLSRIFQLARVFRDGERSATHHPEFTMLEWYRADDKTPALIEDCRGLLCAALEAVAGRECFTWRGKHCDPAKPWRIMSVAEAFDQYCGIDILATAPDPLSPDAGLLAGEARRIGVSPGADDRWEDVFFRIFLDRIEPNLGLETPTVVTDYPLSMAALARPAPHDPCVADRFELFVCGLELANAFGELTDVVEQRRRFEADRQLRRELYGTQIPIDEDFMVALEAGLPESAGIALGFDRLVMLCAGAEHIEDVLWAPVDGGGAGADPL